MKRRRGAVAAYAVAGAVWTVLGVTLALAARGGVLWASGRWAAGALALVPIGVLVLVLAAVAALVDCLDEGGEGDDELAGRIVPDRPVSLTRCTLPTCRVQTGEDVCWLCGGPLVVPREVGKNGL